MKKKEIYATLLVIALLAIDQIIKIWVKTHMALGEQIVIAPWFRIDFIENRGMAWGMQFGSKFGLSLFRIIAVGFLAWYIHSQIAKKAKTGYVVLLCMICAGAAGNIFDSIFYGQIFTASTPWSVSQLVPWGQGYDTSLLGGSVVDMFYFPIIHGTFPSWFPLWGGEEFTFFNAIFNFADACITMGVLCLIIFYWKYLSNNGEEPSATTQKPQPSEANETSEKQ